MRLFRNRYKLRLIRDLVIVPPIPSVDRRGIAIVTRALNDEDYVKEWVDFHLLAGVSHFFIYLDGDFEATMPVYESQVPAGSCTFIPWRHDVHDSKHNRRIHPQTSAFAHAIQNFGQNYRKFAIIDIDEFLVPKGYETIADALEHTKDHPNVSLPWHMFGFSGQEKPSPLGIVTTYTERAREVWSKDSFYTNYKCIIDPCSVIMVGVHSFKTKERGEETCNSEGQITSIHHRSNDKFVSSEHLQLNHYFTRSESEFSKKSARVLNGEASGKVLRDNYYRIASAISADTIHDYSAVEFLKIFRGKTAQSKK